MKARTLLPIALLLVPGQLAAQTVSGGAPAPAVPAAQPLGGPVVPGVCLLSREAIYANAAVGKAASARLNELARATQAEIDTEEFSDAA